MLGYLLERLYYQFVTVIEGNFAIFFLSILSRLVCNYSLLLYGLQALRQSAQLPLVVPATIQFSYLRQRWRLTSSWTIPIVRRSHIATISSHGRV